MQRDEYADVVACTVLRLSMLRSSAIMTSTCGFHSFRMNFVLFVFGVIGDHASISNQQSITMFVPVFIMQPTHWLFCHLSLFDDVPSDDAPINCNANASKLQCKLNMFSPFFLLLASVVQQMMIGERLRWLVKERFPSLYDRVPLFSQPRLDIRHY